jgi:hypothetical protein
MKKFFVLLLSLLILLSLCACGSEAEPTATTNKFVGTWITNADNRELGSFRLLADGKVIWTPFSDSIVDYDIARSGEWTQDGDWIIIFYFDPASNSDKAFILNITDDNTITWREDIYNRAD